MERGKRLDRGECLFNDAKRVINGERQDQYGNPEDAFPDIAARWNQYLRQRLKINADLDAADVTFMLADFKMARECHQRKRDNLVDAVGYLGITDDLLPPEPKSPRSERKVPRTPPKPSGVVVDID